MKRSIGVLLLAFLPFLVTPHAMAVKPTIARIPVDDEFTVDDQCAFSVDVHVTGTIVDISSIDENGTAHDFQAFPQGTAVLTNVDTDESITLNISGPGFFTFHQDGSLTVKGTGLWMFWPNPETGEPGFFQTSGHFAQTIDPEGNVSFELSGHMVDICSQLA
jgi:hypothetical protein